MSERVDLVDEHGNVQMQNVERDDLAKYDDVFMQIVVVVIFNSRGQLLVHQRSKQKTVNPGDIDHVCGGVSTGEDPETAARREIIEEAGVHITSLELVFTNINKYRRYRRVYVAHSDDEPTLTEPENIEWISWKSLEELSAKHETGEYTFTDEFFEEVALAEEHRAKIKDQA